MEYKNVYEEETNLKCPKCGSVLLWGLLFLKCSKCKAQYTPIDKRTGEIARPISLE